MLNRKKDLFVAGIDAGRDSTKVISEEQRFNFPSRVVPYYETGGEGILQRKNHYAVEVLSGGESKGKYYVGEIHRWAEQPGSDSQKMDQNKATDYFRTFVLTALYRAGVLDHQPSVVATGVPFAFFKEMKEGVKEKLKGEHTLKVWGAKGFQDTRIINIQDVVLSPEGYGAFFDDPVDGDVAIADLGSVTFNYLLVRDRLPHGGMSDTAKWGCNNLKQGYADTPEQLAELMVGDLTAKQFPRDIPLRLIGGKATEIEEFVKKDYHNAYAVDDPLFANARGFYEIAKSAVRKKYGVSTI